MLITWNERKTELKIAYEINLIRVKQNFMIVLFFRSKFVNVEINILLATQNEILI